ncbi:MAG: hypothetical protein OIN90_17190 [Candidatus Methanoperedens sp.]|nr:hypothetical protein [Candidatus Methanoperedens sp.]
MTNKREHTHIQFHSQPSLHYESRTPLLVLGIPKSVVTLALAVHFEISSSFRINFGVLDAHPIISQVSTP